jgi:predicted secreted acid phosphatase
MRKLTLSLLLAAALLAGALSGLASAQTPPPDPGLAPPPTPIVIHVGHTPVFELYDGGGGLPYLGSSTSYNAGDWENTLRTYHDSGVYNNQIAQIDAIAQKALARRVHKGHARVRMGHFAKGKHRARVAWNNHGKKLAIVLDVDETSLSNYTAINADNFTFGPQSQAEATNEIGTAIAPTLALFKQAQQSGVAVFFITGRRENTRAHTTSNLNREGFTGFTQLILKPDASTDTTVVYKSGARAAIEQQGYDIVENVGDQYSDLAGGHADVGFKLANPFYFLP